jgi:hypothetical protein
VDVPQEAYFKAFPTILKGLALDYFYINQLSHLPFNKACKHLQNFFKGLGFQHKNLDEWNTITLTTVMAGNIDKSTSKCLQLLIYRLCQLQHGLRLTLQTIDFLHNKIVTSCQGIPVCRYTVSDPLDNFKALINKL